MEHGLEVFIADIVVIVVDAVLFIDGIFVTTSRLMLLMLTLTLADGFGFGRIIATIRCTNGLLVYQKVGQGYHDLSVEKNATATEIELFAIGVTDRGGRVRIIPGDSPTRHVGQGTHRTRDRNLACALAAELNPEFAGAIEHSEPAVTVVAVVSVVVSVVAVNVDVVAVYVVAVIVVIVADAIVVNVIVAIVIVAIVIVVAIIALEKISLGIGAIVSVVVVAVAVAVVHVIVVTVIHNTTTTTTTTTMTSTVVITTITPPLPPPFRLLHA